MTSWPTGTRHQFLAWFRALPTVTAVGMLSACATVGPEFVTPEAPVNADWRSLDASDDAILSEARTDDFRGWWQSFEDPALDALILRARRQNLTLQRAGLRILEARARLGIATGNRFPQFQTANGTLTQVRGSENAANYTPMLDNTFREATVGFDAGWELDVWGRFRRGIEAADAGLQADVAGYDDALVSVTAEVASTYVLLRVFDERLALARANVAIQTRSRDIASIRFRNGLTSELDLQQARALLANTQALIPQLETGLRQAQNGLSILLGTPPSDFADLVGEEGAIPSVPDRIAIGMPADLLRRRPDIRRAEQLAAAQSARIGLTKADLYPSFSLGGSVGLRAANTGLSELGDLFDGNSFEAGAGPGFSWKILNYGRLTNAVRVEDARFQQAVVAYQDTVLQATREVEDALVAFVRGRQRVEFLRDSVAAAERSVELALVQYRDGAADYTRVLNTQQALVAQQDELTLARGEVIRSLIAAYKALGGGWQLRVEEGFLDAAVQREMSERTDWGRLLHADP
ncbi:MAG: efflux transporter outer membrane subunit [Pseudomonadales bacterium]|jgi:NodT family efflux transporter outer membrane factor (OMF) lipoprotein|nr:efflux transporter outer membrane subunit [Pseudomonadales bacterium]